MGNSFESFEPGEIDPAAAAPPENAAPDKLTQPELDPEFSTGTARSSKSVAVIGGGLAGLAAAAALGQRGLKVDLFEQSDRLGGRAGSFEEPWNGQIIDQCQHVALGCCKTFLDFCRRTGVEDCFQRHKTLHFIGPDGTRSDITAAAWLPAPLHLLPGLLRLKFLSWHERLGIVRALRKIVRLKTSRANDDQTIGDWLRRQRQSDTAIERFWSVVLVSALSETVDYVSLAAAKKVFRDGFCSSRHAYELITPRLPLAEIFDRRIAAHLEEKAVRIHRNARVADITRPDRQGLQVHFHDGTTDDFDAVIVAVPARDVDGILFFAEKTPTGQECMQKLKPAAITAVHLWFDQPITTLPHAATVGRLCQWVFNERALLSEYTHGKRTDDAHHATAPATSGENRSAGATPASKTGSYYCQVVISASHRVVKQTKIDLLQAVLADLQAVFPDARQANLLNWRVVTIPHAVFSMQPGFDRLRPSQKTSTPNLFLAGDWTATGWPGTMESAVRSGYLAAEALLKYLGQ